MTLTIIMFGLAGFFNAVMDTLRFHYARSIFPQNGKDKFLGRGITFWRASISWKNKYRDFPDTTPRFFLSTSVLVFLTDGWHLAQTLMLLSFSAGAVPPVHVWYMWFVWWLGLYVVFSLIFIPFFGTFLMTRQGRRN